MADFNREELAWVAGFVDGEGYFGLTNTAGRPTDQRRYKSPKLTISQCDRRVLDRVHESLGCGNITGPYVKKNIKWRPSFTFHVSGFETTQAVICQLWPWLSPVKKEQAKNVLLEYHKFNQRPKLKMGPKPKIPTCHPDRKHAAHGLCDQCYQKAWYKNEF